MGLKSARVSRAMSAVAAMRTLGANRAVSAVRANGTAFGANPRTIRTVRASAGLREADAGRLYFSGVLGLSRQVVDHQVFDFIGKKIKRKLIKNQPLNKKVFKGYILRGYSQTHLRPSVQSAFGKK